MSQHSKSKFTKGHFRPRNPEKYIGNNDIVFRSSWELFFMKFLDESSNILRWASESVVIPYLDPVEDKMRNYFMDFVVVTSDGQKILVEVKPSRQTQKPRKSLKKKQSTVLYEQKSYYTNCAKWRYAEEYCKKRKWKFFILTEKNTFLGFKIPTYKR